MRPPRTRVRVGCDLVALHRMERVLLRNGPRFMQEIFTPAEMRHYNTEIATLCRCFAVKESLLKAIGIGFVSGIKLTDIDVSFDTTDKHRVRVSMQGTSATLLRSLGCSATAWSWIQEDHAVAIALLTPET